MSTEKDAASLHLYHLEHLEPFNSRPCYKTGPTILGSAIVPVLDRGSRDQGLLRRKAAEDISGSIPGLTAAGLVAVQMPGYSAAWTGGKQHR
jgi:hypothetical protein